MAPPKAVLSDVDRTLVDTVDLHAQGGVEALETFGIEADFGDLRLQIGKGGDQLLPDLIPADKLEAHGREFRADLFKRKYMSQVRAFPGVRELFGRIRPSGQKIILASSGYSDEVEAHQTTANIADLIDHATSSEDAERSKPFPDIFEAALGKLGLQHRADAMVVGDTPCDAEAARAAGLASIGVLGGGLIEQGLHRGPSRPAASAGELRRLASRERLG